MSKKKAPPKTVKKNSKGDFGFWILAIVLLVIGLSANYYFTEIAWALKLTGWIILACLLVSIVALTSQGKLLWKFMKDARVEMRKVTWPKREDTVKRTAQVGGLVILTALILWGVDSILLWVIGLLTGQRG